MIDFYSNLHSEGYLHSGGPTLYFSFTYFFHSFHHADSFPHPLNVRPVITAVAPRQIVPSEVLVPGALKEMFGSFVFSSTHYARSIVTSWKVRFRVDHVQSQPHDCFCFFHVQFFDVIL